MATQDLNIVIKLIDQVTAPLNKVTANLQRFGHEVTNLGNTISRTGQKMAFLGSFIEAPFLLAAKAAAEYSPAINKVLTEMGNSFSQLYVAIANSILPVLRQLGNALSNIVAWFKSLNPEIRDSIMQWTMIGGAALVAGGVFLKVVGSMISLAGKLIGALNPITVSIALIAAAIIYMVTHWENVKTFVLPGVRNLQIAVDMLAIGWEKVAIGIAHALAFASAMIGKQDWAVYWEEQVISLQKSIEGLEANMADAMSGKGWAESLDKGIMNLQGFWAQVQGIFKHGNDAAKQEIAKLGNFVKDVAMQMGRAMEQSLGNFFYNVLTGQIKSAQQAFAEFGQAILQILTQAIAKLVLFYTLGQALMPFLGFNMFAFHQGGVVKRAHSGMALSNDEVPIIAQAGEGIVSRRGMQAMGRGNFDRMNRGDMGSGSNQPSVIVYQPIQAWDYKDVYRNRKTLAQGIVEEIRRNGDFRTAMKEYVR